MWARVAAPPRCGLGRGGGRVQATVRAGLTLVERRGLRLWARMAAPSRCGLGRGGGCVQATARAGRTVVERRGLGL